MEAAFVWVLRKFGSCPWSHDSKSCWWHWGSFLGFGGLWVLARACDWIITDNKGVRISVGGEASPDPTAFA